MASHTHFLSFVLLVFYLTQQVVHSHASNLVSHSSYVSDVCDWSGSGSPNVDSDRSVVPIYLRCSSGHLQWLYPKGGLRVVLKLGTGNKDFRGCIRVAQHNSTQILGDPKHAIRTVRIYLEGKRKLHQIYATDDGKHQDLLRCFVSVHAFMALFIETEPSVGNVHNPNEHIAFSYDLQEVTSKNTKPEGDMSECRPCSPQQIISLYCSADFAILGKVTYFHHRPEVEMTEFNVKPTFVFRFPVDDSSYVNDFNASANAQHEIDNSVEEMDRLSSVNLNRPLKCASGATARTEYLFLGRKMLGNYFITCAPTLSDWRHISKKALEAGTNQCHID